jgi:hypothetical protein
MGAQVAIDLKVKRISQHTHPKKKKSNEKCACCRLYFDKYCGGLPLSSAVGRSQKDDKKEEEEETFLFCIYSSSFHAVILYLSESVPSGLGGRDRCGAKKKSRKDAKLLAKKYKCVSFFLLYNRKRRKSFDGNRQAFNLTLMMR